MKGRRKFLNSSWTSRLLGLWLKRGYSGKLRNPNLGRCCKTYNCFEVTSLRAARVVSLKDSSAFLQPSSPQTALLCRYDGSRILRAKARQHILLKTYQYLQSKRDGFSTGLWDVRTQNQVKGAELGWIGHAATFKAKRGLTGLEQCGSQWEGHEWELNVTLLVLIVGYMAAIDWMLYPPPPKFICCVPPKCIIPSGMVFGGGALGRWLGHGVKPHPWVLCL